LRCQIKTRKTELNLLNKKMRDLTQHFNLYNKIVAEEIKINENLRYRKSLQVHKLQDNILELKKIMAVPRLYSNYVENSKAYHIKKNEGEVLAERDVDLYDLSYDSSILFYKQHQSMVHNLNDKSRISLPAPAKLAIYLNDSDEDNSTDMLSKFDHVPRNIMIPPGTFNSKSNIERHNDLVKELKGSRNKPSMLGQFRSVTNLEARKSMSKKIGNTTERSAIKLGSLDRKIESSTDFTDKIFRKEFALPKTVRQKKLFGKMKTNQSLPQLKNINKDIMSDTKESKRY
jgi:hypothetical protein